MQDQVGRCQGGRGRGRGKGVLGEVQGRVRERRKEGWWSGARNGEGEMWGGVRERWKEGWGRRKGEREVWGRVREKWKEGRGRCSMAEISMLSFFCSFFSFFFLLVSPPHFFCYQGRWPLPRAVSNVDFKLEDINRSGRGGKWKRGRGGEWARGENSLKIFDMEKVTGRKENNYMK
jgi:hypothetical protein